MPVFFPTWWLDKSVGCDFLWLLEKCQAVDLRNISISFLLSVIWLPPTEFQGHYLQVMFLLQRKTRQTSEKRWSDRIKASESFDDKNYGTTNDYSSEFPSDWAILKVVWWLGAGLGWPKYLYLASFNQVGCVNISIDEVHNNSDALLLQVYDKIHKKIPPCAQPAPQPGTLSKFQVMLQNQNGLFIGDLCPTEM